jgi:hypothetical protein
MEAVLRCIVDSSRCEWEVKLSVKERCIFHYNILIVMRKKTNGQDPVKRFVGGNNCKGEREMPI